MDTSRISFGEMVAAASGIALFIFMFLPWFELEGCGDAQIAGISIDCDLSAWSALKVLDLVLLLVILVAVGVAVARAAGVSLAQLPASPGVILAAGGALGFLLVLFRLLVTPDIGSGGIDVETTRKFGVFLGLIASGGLAYGGYRAMNEANGAGAPGGRLGGGAGAGGPAPSTPAGGAAGGTTAPPPPPPSGTGGGQPPAAS